MFESVVPEAFAKPRRRLFYALLPLSLAIHGFGLGAALVTTIWTVVFPLQSPQLVSAYSLVTIPEPPPPPPAPPPAAAPTPKPAAPPPPIDKIVAPTIIPDTIPQVAELAPAEQVPAPTDTGPGVEGGVPGGRGAAPVAKETVAAPPPFPDDGRVHIERGKNLPLETISQEFPPYPADAKKLQLEDQVVIRYTIGKNGRVTEVQILSHANFASFDTAVLDTVRSWRFRPMIKEGKPVEVTQDLGFNFVLIRH